VNLIPISALPVHREGDGIPKLSEQCWKDQRQHSARGSLSSILEGGAPIDESGVKWRPWKGQHTVAAVASAVCGEADRSAQREE